MINCGRARRSGVLNYRSMKFLDQLHEFYIATWLSVLSVNERPSLVANHSMHYYTCTCSCSYQECITQFGESRWWSLKLKIANEPLCQSFTTSHSLIPDRFFPNRICVKNVNLTCFNLAYTNHHVYKVLYNMLPLIIIINWTISTTKINELQTLSQNTYSSAFAWIVDISTILQLLTWHNGTN